MSSTNVKKRTILSGEVKIGVKHGNTKLLGTPLFVAPLTIQSTVLGGGIPFALVFGATSIDLGNNFSANQFTAPVTGLYEFVVRLPLDQVGAGHTLLTVDFTGSDTTVLATSTITSLTQFDANVHVTVSLTALDVIGLRADVLSSTTTIDILAGGFWYGRLLTLT